jgi:phospho-N-acetylmuramoyl-pentapeptide-transferase
MGDSGSLTLGSIVAVSSLLCNFELSLIFLAFIPMCETISVILQVASFKFRNGKRIFKIAPVHHHFESLGYKETKIVYNFLTISIVISSVFIASIFIK